jgi:hypothetical protein
MRSSWICSFLILAGFRTDTANADPINVDPNSDSVESAEIVGKTSGKTTMTLSLLASFESGGTLTVNSRSGVTWMVTGQAAITGDTLTLKPIGGSLNGTITAVYYSEVFDTFDDKVTVTEDFTNDAGKLALVPASPMPPVFGTPPEGLAIVNVTLRNPFSQALIVTEDSIKVTGGGTSGVGDTPTFDPFADAFQVGAFAIQPFSSIFAQVGVGVLPGGAIDQDGVLSLGGFLADGTPASTEQIPFDPSVGLNAVTGTFAQVPEPATSTLLLAGLAALAAGAATARRRRSG